MPDTDIVLREEAEHLHLRRLPPVDPVVAPERFSQTLLRHANTCQRAGYLYVKHDGGMPAHELDRGSALHMAQAKATMLVLEQYAIDPGPGDVDYMVDEHTAKLMLEETLEEHPELTVPLHERDDLRMMMSHLSRGFPINPAIVVAVERKFILDLGDYRVSGILDLASIDGGAGNVRDYKTEWDVPSQQEYDATFQGRLYAVALVYGHPVTEAPCNCGSERVYRCLSCGGRDLYPGETRERPGMACTTCEAMTRHEIVACEACGGRGYIEQLEEPLGGHLQTVDVGEVFPRYMSCRDCGSKEHEDGVCGECGGPMEVPVRNAVLARIEIDAIRRDLEAQCRQLAGAFARSEFPAVSGNHCKRCPCEPECPLPRHLRNFAGAIQTDDDAKEAAEWLDRVTAKTDATRKEIKSFCKIEGPLRYGADQVFEFGPVVRWETDWEKIEKGAARAAQYGEPFDIGQFRRQKLGTQFRARTLTESELAAEREQANSEEAA